MTKLEALALDYARSAVVFHTVNHVHRDNSDPEIRKMLGLLRGNMFQAQSDMNEEAKLIAGIK